MKVLPRKETALYRDADTDKDALDAILNLLGRPAVNQTRTGSESSGKCDEAKDDTTRRHTPGPYETPD
jgi:hypothetical protein